MIVGGHGWREGKKGVTRGQGRTEKGRKDNLRPQKKIPDSLHPQHIADYLMALWGILHRIGAALRCDICGPPRSAQTIRFCTPAPAGPFHLHRARVTPKGGGTGAGVELRRVGAILRRLHSIHCRSSVHTYSTSASETAGSRRSSSPSRCSSSLMVQKLRYTLGLTVESNVQLHPSDITKLDNSPAFGPSTSHRRNAPTFTHR